MESNGSPPRRPRRASRVITTTLFELITEVARHTRNDAETVAVVAEILRRGQVRTGGRPLAREVARAA